MPSPPLERFSVVRGDDRERIISFFDSETNAPVPLADIANVWFTMREGWAAAEEDDAAAIFQASLLGGGILPEGASSVRLTLPHAATAAWMADEYVYDVQVSTVAGLLTTTQRGFVRIEPDVTRAV